jgi:flagellar biosynthetic protein FliR
MNEVLARIDLAGWATHYVIVLARTLGLFLFVPIFGSDLVPLRLRLGMAAILAAAFLPLAPRIEVATMDGIAWALVTTRELAVGLAFGLAARTLFGGVETAAGLIAGQSGFALASMIDPTSGDQALTPAIFQNLVTTTLFLAANLHHLFIRGIADSYALFPPAATALAVDTLDGPVMRFGARLFTVAVELAAPALIVTVAVDVVMALVGRAMPQVPILLVGYPFKLAAGLVAMVILVLATGQSLAWIGRTIADDGATLLGALAGP